jgi:hypothetical protein
MVPIFRQVYLTPLGTSFDIKLYGRYRCVLVGYIPQLRNDFAVAYASRCVRISSPSFQIGIFGNTRDLCLSSQSDRFGCLMDTIEFNADFSGNVSYQYFDLVSNTQDGSDIVLWLHCYPVNDMIK